MSFYTTENSVEDSSIVVLYDFYDGVRHWRYTNYTSDYTYQSSVYSSAAITMSNIERTSELAKENLMLRCNRELEIADIFRISPPSSVVQLSIIFINFGASDSDAYTVWSGRVLNAEWSNNEASLRCESVFTSMKRAGLRRKYQKACPFALYSTQCGVNKSGFKVTASLNYVSGTTVKSTIFDSYSDDYFSGGFIEVFIDSVPERRFIISHTGDTLVLDLYSSYLSAGLSIDTYPGCDHTLTTCKNKFSNSLNYGGVPSLPSLNPFDGTSLF